MLPPAPVPAPLQVSALTLRGTTLPWWSFAGLGAAILVVVAGLFAVTPMQGTADYLVVTLPTYVVAMTLLSRRFEGRRRATNRLVTALVLTAFLVALLPLVLVLGYTVSKGLQRFDLTFLTHSMNNIAENDPDGGAYHAILGTLEQVGIATLMAVPFGVLVAIYLVEYGKGKTVRLVSVLVDVMTGLPSIVAGLFVLSLWVLLLHQGFSGFAGALALTVLMLPTVVRSSEEVLKLVPDPLREAALALGLPRWRAIVSVVLPTAVPGIATGVILGISRVAGETAPLLLTVFGAQAINADVFSHPQAALPLFVFTEAQQPLQNALDRAWAGALTLILLVMVLNLIARLIAARVGNARLER